MADLPGRDAALLLDMLLAARDAQSFVEGLTILSLSKRNKMYIAFVQGRFKQGGTGARSGRRASVPICKTHQTNGVYALRISDDVQTSAPPDSRSEWRGGWGWALAASRAYSGEARVTRSNHFDQTNERLVVTPPLLADRLSSPVSRRPPALRFSRRPVDTTPSSVHDCRGTVCG